ncbi:amidase domain-containing protein [Paenibacillus zanthoxyli]|uniref:amidase domain-containing protein n=1 Tax=Paenibacillus zanthoxyli TaxID=369399 RepID=UPI0004BB9E1B|nr:amidase domain-containing protein [Paenibacillus zanthoxyli]
MKRTPQMCLVIAVFLLLFGAEPVSGTESTETEVRGFLTHLFAARSEFVTNMPSGLEKYYDQKYGSSRHAYRVEANRNTYLHAWGEHRGIHFVDSQSRIRITRIRIEGDTAQITLTHSQKLSYMYANKILPTQWFGLGTWHTLTLKKNKGEWKVVKEWYLDPLDESPKQIPGTPEETEAFPDHKEEIRDGKKYKRQKAVAYANKYAGSAWGAGNKGRYNPKYLNYNGKGGDCTNFASQVVGDQEEGGGLKMSGPWRYHYHSGGNSTWVQTDSFKNFIVRSGYGRVIAQGGFSDLVKSTRQNPDGAFAKLFPGDLIAHVIRNDVDHFSIVTGFDENGYPLVNSHTADRFRAPYDLGWDKNTKYILIHIND